MTNTNATILIGNPKILSPEATDAFRIAMRAMGARFNETYNAWNVPADRAADARALVAALPVYVPIPNTRAW